MADALQALAGEKYISVETYRKEGAPVRTPVWFVPIDGQLLFTTGGDSFKVKRLGRNPKARFAACDMRGTVHGGWWEATAEVLVEGDLAEKARAAIQKKYGLMNSLMLLVARLRGRLAQRRVIVVRPGTPAT